MTGGIVEANLVATFMRQAEAHGERPFLWHKRDGEYQPMSWAEMRRQVEALASLLQQQGVTRGDRVLLVAENRPEWPIADLAIMHAGAITVPAYTTSTVDGHRYTLQHAGCVAAIVSTARLAQNLVPALADQPGCRLLLHMEPLTAAVPETATALDWATALEQGRAAPSGFDGARDLHPDDVACFMYTSGTGGQPKAVMLTHGNISSNVGAVLAIVKDYGGLQDDVFLSFLPLSHSYEHTCGQFLAISMGAQIYYAEGVDKLASNFMETRPTFIPCVPRLHEVMRQKILSQVERQGGLKAKLFHATLALGTKRYRQGGRLNPVDGAADVLLTRLVRRKIHARFGGRARALISGGAPLAEEVGVFFHALGLPLLQGYGQTESAPLVSVNRPHAQKHHTVGPPVHGVELRIAEDGEILVRGGNVMKGYWQDEEATAQVLRDGWLYTGDIGQVDADGYLQITDRKKDLIVNSGGDNISPQRVEGLACLEPELAQVIVYGDKRPYLVALVVPDDGFMRDYARGNGHKAALADLADDAEFRKAVARAINRVNAKLTAIEKIRKFHIMPEPFTVENAMMTPTLKLRRPLIKERHGDLIESLYA